MQFRCALGLAMFESHEDGCTFHLIIIQLQQRSHFLQYFDQRVISNRAIMYSKQKMESIKESAYFDYFKFFSLNAAETIRKLQTTFQDQISQDVFFDANHMFKRVKTLLSSYEVLLMEIKDSCQFVEIPEFGVCIMKIFFQLMSIIKFMGKSIILRSGLEKNANEKQKRADQRHTIISSSPTEFYQNNLKASATPQSQQRQNFRMKEMASHIFNDIRQEVSNLEKQHKNDSLQNDKTYEKISKGRQKLQQIQSSQSEAVLSQTVNMLYKKSQHINSFINIVQTNIALQSKENCVDTYLKIKEQFDEDCAPRFENAKEKLNKLFKEHVLNYQKKKRSLMMNVQCQVKIEDQEYSEEKSKTSFHSNKKSAHNTNDQIKKLKSEVKLMQEENKTLKKFIQQKVQQYENIITKLRSEKLSMECKSNSDNKSVTLDKYKSASSKKSQSYIENIQNTDNISEAQSHFSVQSENKQFFHTFDSTHNPTKRSKVNLAASRGNRGKVKFHFNEKHLSICTKIVNWVICHDEKDCLYGDDKKNQKIEKINQSTEFQQIEERPSQHQCSFRDNAQLSESLLKQSKFKSKKQRTSLMIFNQLKQNKDQLAHTDTGFNKSKKSFHPLCSIMTKKLLKKRQSNQPQTDTADPSNYGDSNKNVNNFYEKRGNKMNQSEGYGGKTSIFQRMEKENQKRFSNNHEITQQIPIISIQPILMEPKRLKCIKFMEGIQIIELQSLISFERSDLANLFITEDNASNYQILNITLISKNNHYFSTFQNKNIAIKDISKSANNSKNSSYKNLSPKYQQKQDSINIGDIMINIIYKYLKILRQSKKDCNQKNYHIIKNFIRFPYSSVHRKNQSQWKQYSTQNNVIQFLQLKKCIGRIMKLHAGCRSPSNKIIPTQNQQSVTPSFSDKNGEDELLCDHWHSFVNRIGLNLIEANQ